jgi:glycosyltransferase involved in cell wall biosynthesis
VTLAIGLLHFTAPPVVGGVETVLWHHARLLADAGYAVRVIAGRGGPVDPRVSLARIPLADARNPAVAEVQRALDRGAVPPAFEGLVASLAADLEAATAGLDLVIAHNVCRLAVNTPLTAALRRVLDAGHIRKLVAWDHDIAATSERYAGRLHPGYPWDLFREPWPGVLSVTVSKTRRAELARGTGISPDAIRVVPNGVDRDTFVGLAPTTRQLIDTLNLSGADPVLLTPARVTPRKNLELAVRVVAELRRTGDDARVLITGAPDPHDPHAEAYLGSLREQIAATAPDGVHLLVDGPRAWRSKRVVADLFRVADALFLPSRDEGFGLPILEAATARLPILCADIPALRELAGDDATYFDPAGDAAAVAAVVRARLGSDPAHRLAARVRRTYGWPAVFRDHVEPLIREAAGRGAAIRDQGR